jgi:hypothetical protein
VLALEPSPFVSDNEIAAAALATADPVFNPQQQFAMAWPASPVVALAHVDQLSRSRAIDAGLEAELRSALASARSVMDTQAPRNDRDGLARRLRVLASSLTPSAAMSTNARSRDALSKVLLELAGRLQ